MSLAKEEEIQEIIKNLDATKATGIDNIPCRLVKLSEKVITKPLTAIINDSISKSEFPNDLKIDKIVPIYKNPKEGSRLIK